MKNTGDEITINFYDAHAKSYFDATIDVDMSECHKRFVKYLHSGDSIIDIGFGSGRDIKCFLECGFEVDGIDASIEMCKLALEYTGADVKCCTIQDWKPKKRYSGIWANASLVHLSKEDFEDFFRKAKMCLKESGVIYFSLKNGIDYERDDKGRYFLNLSVDDIDNILNTILGDVEVERWETEDKLSRQEINWNNYIIKTKEMGVSK